MKLLDKDEIQKKVQRRVGEYGDDKREWFDEWFVPTLRRIDIRLVTWEEILLDVRRADEPAGGELSEFYSACLVNADKPDHVRKVLHPVAGIQMIDVDPAWRRRGIATRMIRRAMTVVADKRLAFDLWVEEDNEAAIALYEKLGFVFTGMED